MKRLERENRPATEDDKAVLARWSGWGAVPILFASEPKEKEPRYQQGGARYGKIDQDHARWAEYRELRTKLSQELTPLEWQQARRGTLSMHYTPQPIAEAMWDGLKALGFERGDVLEAGSGSGTFFGLSPAGAHLTGVELDPTTARIAQAIYPDANILNENFAETDADPGTFDAAIGNVPFASVPFGDKRYPAESLHNGFITKELALTRPGGITLLLTSRHTLDSKGDKARKQIAKYGDLLGAVRLPAGVFNDAGTSVVTDVLVLRRRADGDEPADTSWLNAPERKVGESREHVNTYFTEHPEHVLGELTTQSSPFGPRLTVKGDPAKAADQLRDALMDIATKAKANGNGYQPHPDGDNRPPVILQTAREKHANDWTGRLYEGDDGKLYQHVNGGNPVAVEPSDGRGDQLRALMELRDVAAELRTLDRKNAEDERAEQLRARLRDLHTAYVERYGPLSKPGQVRSMKTGTRPDGKEERTPTAVGYFRSDPDAGSVLALERWDADKQEPILSRVFDERAAARRQPLDRTDDPKTALSAVVAATGEVDLGEIARLLNVDPQEALRALGNEVFTDPSTGRLELAGAYLSGPVRDKLQAARRAAETDPAFAVNVSALEAVQPTDRAIGEFTPEMSAHWTPPELLQGFLREYLGDKTLRVAHDDRYGWMLYTGQVPKANNVMHGVAADEEKGTKGKSAVEIARSLLGHGSLTVYRDDKRRDVDEKTSRLVRHKADQMRAEFAKYATANADRLTRLTDAYNKIMNGHVVRSYDGMSPSLDGFTPERTPHAWQLAGAARMQFERSVILAHEVGLGKTSTLVMGTQALKASGQIEKPFAVVPDHLAQQWYDEARFLYPNAEIHLITSADLADGRRDSTLEWLRANRPDLVIFTEPAFGSIKMSPEAQEEYEFRELEALREQLDRQYEDASNPEHPFIVAKIEARIATVQNKISRNDAPRRTPGQTYWDDLGFDYAVVDEAHRYKGVGFRSREGGGDPASIRGIDLHQKLTDLHRRRAGRATVTLATGTPLSNSITEQYTMLALAAPWVLDSYRAGAPDLWAATFGRKTLRIENAPDGSGLRIVERFSEFHNRRAMKTMWGLVADTKRADDVGIPRPKIAGGGPNLIMVEPTKDQTARLKGLVARGRAIHNGDVDQSQDNMLAVSNDGTSVALDPRLIDANAPAGNKLAAVAARHVERYHQHKGRVYKTHYSPDGSAPDHPVPGALQMIFLNEGVPGTRNRGSFDAYAELKRLMVEGGIPAEKIAFVQDHKKTGKPEELAELFRKARDGEIAVLIGSSSVAGTGMNAQNRMISLTHVDLDWGAAQMEQRNGRAIRYGNQNPEVDIDIFATKGSLDGWKAGFVASKAEGLIDIQRPEMADSDTRDTVTELDVDYPDYETMEAEIGGNPHMSQLMKARRRLKDLEIDQHNEAAERVRRQEALADLHQELAETRDGIARREEALPRIRDVRDSFDMKLGGLSYTERSDAAAALHRQVTTQLLEHNHDGMGPWKILGQFGGLDIGVRTERRPDGKLVAHVGFPDLARSDFERGPEDLKKKGAGSGMITRLTNALDKAPALQEADRARLPELEEQIALLQSAQAAVDLSPQIEHARARANLLDDIVGRIAELDKLPDLDADTLDKKLSKAQRRDLIEERHQDRVPLQAAVDAAVRELKEFDRKFPQPERPEKPEKPEKPEGPEPKPDRVRLSATEVSQTLDQLRPDHSGNDKTSEEPVDTPDTTADAEAGGDVAQPHQPAEEQPGRPLSPAWGKPEQLIAVTMPAALVEFHRQDGTAAMEDPDTRKALDEAKRTRNGALRVTAPLPSTGTFWTWHGSSPAMTTTNNPARKNSGPTVRTSSASRRPSPSGARPAPPRRRPPHRRSTPPPTNPPDRHTPTRPTTPNSPSQGPRAPTAARRRIRSPSATMRYPRSSTPSAPKGPRLRPR
ncbi:helicase-related protein [Streptomyces sp. CA-181903]|uniref:helicase-related protein n=1 Tax=Streptomyces sp. CA-181903 TaxID=3240055 RepID=UPI003D94C32B